MSSCPWCGTNYTSFQSNCDNCGGTMPDPHEEASRLTKESLPVPPAAPRTLPRNYICRLLFSDGWSIMALIFTFIGAIFGVIGVALTVTVVAAFVGLPFAGIGAFFLVIGVSILVWRTQEAKKTVRVLQAGEPAIGEIIDVVQNYNIRVNGRYPWKITYWFDVMGQEFEGSHTTLSQPDLSHQAGNPVYVLYLQDDPEQNAIYPHPLGYYGT